MATGEKNFDTACFRERSMAQMLLGKTIGTESDAAAASNPRRIRYRDEGFEGESLGGGLKVEKRGLMDIDLNVAPPEDVDCELAAADGSRNGQEAPPPPANVSLDVSRSEMVVFENREPSSNGIGEEVGVEVETKTTENRVDAEAGMVEINSRKKRWVALLEFAENALVEKEEENRNQKLRASQESELSGEPPKGAQTRRKISGQRRPSLDAEWNGENEVATVVRSSRGRAVAIPNKYRDSVLGAVAIAEAELPRRGKSGKSASAFSTKRKSR